MDLQTGADNNDFENLIWMIFWRYILHHITANVCLQVSSKSLVGQTFIFDETIP